MKRSMVGTIMHTERCLHPNAQSLWINSLRWLEHSAEIMKDPRTDSLS